MTIVVNFIAGPGTGKSTIAANVFAELKWFNVNAELITKFVKDKVWENSLDVLKNQLYMFTKQYYRLQWAANYVDVVITDSPLVMSLVYGEKESDAFKTLVMEKFMTHYNLNFFLKRKKPYNPVGRDQAEEKAMGLDNKLKSILEEYELPYMTFNGSPESVSGITEEILNVLALTRKLEINL